MTTNFPLISKLQAIPDYRKAKGRRHDLWLLLLLILLGTFCGYRGYRPLANFCQTHWSTLCAQLALPPDTRIPSYSTFHRVLHQVDFNPLLALFNEWAALFLRLSGTTWVAGNGRAIKSTLSDYLVSTAKTISAHYRLSSKLASILVNLSL